MPHRRVWRNQLALPVARPRLPRLALPLGAAALLASLLALIPPRPANFTALVLALCAATLAMERLAGPRWRERWMREGAALALVLVAGALFFADLGSILALQKSQADVTAGIIPVSDANGYVRGALSLVETGRLDEWSSRRPVAAGFLALLLDLTGQSFKATLYVQTFISWACLSVALREVLLRLGLTAAVMFLAVTAGHHSLYVGTFLTEPLGFALGALGFALLLRGFADLDRRAALVGIVVFGLALVARSGPTPALPLLAIYAAYHFRGARRFDWPMLGAALIAAASPMIIGGAQVSIIGARQHMMQGNLSYTLYGLAVGAKGWGQTLIDHPELYSVTSDVQRSKMIFGFFWEALQKHPSVFFASLTQAWWHALSSPFATLIDIGLPTAREVFFLPAVLGAVALARTFLRRGRDLLGFAVVVLAATVACYPILADAWPRVLAPSVCCHAAVVALGASLIVRAPPREMPCAPPSGQWLSRAGLAVAAVITLPPLLLRFAHPDLSALAAPSCGAGEIPLAFRVARGSGVTVDAATRSQLQRSGLPGLGDAKTLPEGARFITGFNLLDPLRVGSDYLVVTNAPDEAAARGHVAMACARLLGDNRWWHRVYAGRLVE